MDTDGVVRERIRALDPVQADLIEGGAATFSREPLPFYRAFTLLKAAIALPRRELELRYADDGQRLIHLTGRPEPVYSVNDAEGLALAAADILPYVRFFMGNVTDQAGRPIEVVESPDEVAWLAATETDPRLRAARTEASARIVPLVATVAGDTYRVMGTAIEGRRLVELALDVDGQGRVTLPPTPRILVDDLPVRRKM